MIAAGDWTLHRQIGAGATATVSLASTSSGELFAVKSSPLRRSAPLRREHLLLSSLSSPHIISPKGFQQSQNQFHLFLEYADRGPLSALSGKLPEPQIRSFARQILLALSHLHSKNISHGDVKGQNLLLFSNGVLKLADFGCARRIGEEGGCFSGTPGFMSPEAARGEEAGAAGDVWGMGCAVVEMAGGLPEFENGFAAIYRRGFGGEEVEMPGWVSEEGRDFVGRCLVREVEGRWTVEELLRHPFVAGEEVFSLGRWVSPKSALDFGLWNLGEEEGEEELGLGEKRVLGLGEEKAEWGWGEEWIVVRSR